MSEFRTKIKLPVYTISINHHDQLLSLGSCFAENIGQRLHQLKFKISLNPFGILYNPIAIIDNLNRLLEGHHFEENELFEHNGLWHSFAHHSIFSKRTKDETFLGIQQNFEVAAQQLKSCNRLILTLGTAHVFENIATGEVVANCHKLPAASFFRKKLSVSDITEKFLPFLRKLKIENPDLAVIFTVSPIRHIRGGLLANQQSKATLHLAIAAICEQLNFAHYFPAYEIMMDDLRDYRFYEADMIHPSQVAIEYIWQQFHNSFFNENTENLIQKIEKLITATQHRPFHPTAPLHQQFLKKQLEKLAQLSQEAPFLNLEKERDLFQQQKK